MLIGVLLSVMAIVGDGDAAAPVATGGGAARIFFPAVPLNQVVAINLGLGSAVGELGLTWQLGGLGPLEVELGLGEGVSGAQASLMTKLIWAGDLHHDVAFGVGVSRGGGQTDVAAAVYPTLKTVGHPIWLNIDLLTFEYRRPSHFFASFSVGFTRGLGGGQLIYSGAADGSVSDWSKESMLYQTRVEIGFWH